MPGVYRDEDGQYTYQSTNDFEDRRRRDLDDRAAGRGDLGPQSPDARPPLTWNPPPGPAPAPAAVEQAQIPVVEQAPANDPGLEILVAAEAIERAEQNAFFERLVGALPAQAGENPAFDRIFENPNTPAITAQDLFVEMDDPGFG